MKALLSKTIDNLDITLAVTGCVLSIPLTLYLHLVIRSPLYTAVGFIIYLVCMAYLLIRRRSTTTVPKQSETTLSIYLLLNILFFCLLIYSIMVFQLRADLYTRPLGYFISTAAMAAVLSVEIIFLPLRNSATVFTLFKIILIGLSLVWTPLLIYHGIVGIDPWYHQKLTMNMLDAGYINWASRYSSLPSMHLLIGATSLITGLSYKVATMFSVCMLQVICNILFVFLLGKFMHSTRAGLMAALLLSVADLQIRFAYWTIPNSLGVIFIPIIIYLLFKVRQEKPAVSICLSALFMIVLILTHPVASSSLVMLLFFTWLGFEFYQRLHYRAATEKTSTYLFAFILFAIATLGYWTFFSGHISILRGLIRTGFSVDNLATMPPGGIALVPNSLQSAFIQYREHVVPFSEQLFNYAGLFVYFTFAFIGAFIMFSRDIRNRYGFAFVFASLLILAVNFIGIITNRSFMVGRWNYLLQVLLAIPVGVAFLWLGNLPAKKTLRACLAGIMTFTLTLLMVMSIQANTDNRTFSPNTIVRYGFRQSEVEAMNTVSNMYNGKIAGDCIYSLLGRLPELAGKVVTMCDQLYSRDFTECSDKLVLIRKEIVINPLNIAGLAPFRLDYDPNQALSEQGFSRVYQCDTVSGFVK